MQEDPKMLNELMRQTHNVNEMNILKDIANALDQSAIIAITDRTGKIFYVNEQFVKISHYDYSELIGSNHKLLNSKHHPPEFFKTMWATIGRGEKWRGEICNKRKDGTFYWVDTMIVPFLDEKGKPYQYISIRYDITARKTSEQMIKDLAYNDQLTHLPNRMSLRRMVDRDIEAARLVGSKLALVYLNIDRLRYVNDSLGHEAGDYILSQVASRLKKCLAYEHTIGRISGDEFAFLLKDVKDAAHAEEITKEVQKSLEETIEVKGHNYTMSYSMGIALFPQHAKTHSELSMKAEQALATAREHGGAGFEMYKPGTASKTLERILLESQLRKSVKLGHFHLDYQPKVDLKTGELTGVEALVRWDHPDLGRISPDKFIPVAEETKIILPLGEWILREACKQIKKWQNKGFEAFRTAINLSATQLEEPSIIHMIKDILSETEVSPDLIEIELTESAFADREGMQETIEQIRALGVTVALDDFGTGYSAFSYIKELPADTLKIDMSFIRDIHKNEDSRAIVKAIVGIANTVGLNVIAEGVEYEEQIKVLLECGCKEGQGYFFSKPTTPEACEYFMRLASENE